MTKFLTDEWMIGNDYYSHKDFETDEGFFGKKTLKDLKFKPFRKLDEKTTIKKCFQLFETGYKTIPILMNGKVEGVVTQMSVLR